MLLSIIHNSTFTTKPSSCQQYVQIKLFQEQTDSPMKKRFLIKPHKIFLQRTVGLRNDTLIRLNWRQNDCSCLLNWHTILLFRTHLGVVIFSPHVIKWNHGIEYYDDLWCHWQINNAMQLLIESPLVAWNILLFSASLLFLGNKISSNRFV